MTRVKILKDVERYSLDGLGGEILRCVKGDVLEIADHRVQGLIQAGCAKLTKKAVTEKPEDEGSEDELFGLNEEGKARILGLGKNEIETILRLYGIEVDKRHSMDAVRKNLVETVSNALPDSEDNAEGLISFYNTCFKVQLDLSSYEKEDLTNMALDMGEILSETLKV